MHVELIYRSGCPKLEPAREQLRRAFYRAKVTPTWQEWSIDDPDSPAHIRERASPTFLVRGADVCSSSEFEILDGGPCRVYRCEDGPRRAVPLVGRIAAALRARIVADLSLKVPGCHLGSAATDWSDEALMAGYQLGDVAAFEILFERYQQRLFGYFMRRLADPELAADLFQRTMLRIHRARHDYDPSRPFGAWAFSIAGNLVKDELKLRSRRPGDAQWTEPSDDAVVAVRDPERELLSKSQVAALREAVAALPEKQRDVVVLHKFDGLSFREIAEELGEQVEAVKARALRGYRNLRTRVRSDRAAPCCR